MDRELHENVTSNPSMRESITDKLAEDYAPSQIPLNHHGSLHKQVRTPISEFYSRKVIKSCQRKYIQSLWEELCNNISNTSVDQISSLEECINEVVEEVTKIDSSIALPLKRLFSNLAHEGQEV
ncbi:hypothetical protein ACH5RR_001490 [Cinchona calisaya]|uniref:Uncharacterized protein n=1 Tax=Cinchona calisaya TaxID=153742 RepID=A0ABD3B3M7_9GENT